MLEGVRTLIEKNTDRAAFFSFVGQKFPRGSAEYTLISKAYETAKSAFRNEIREGNGARYFEHLRGVALIDMEYLRISDPEIISGALLHDIVEDIAEWSFERLAFEFSPRVSELVWWVTKPPLAEYGGDKEARNRAYHQNLKRAPRDSIIIKLPDRLHNLIDMWGVSEEKQQRKVIETQDFYLPIAEQHILLIHEIEAALESIMSGWNKGLTTTDFGA